MKYSENTIEKFAKSTGKSVEIWKNIFAEFGDEYGLVSPGDNDYPFIVDKNGFLMEPRYTTRRDEYQTKVPNRKGAPHFLFYRGDISLLSKSNFTRNVAVVGLLNPTEEIVSREKAFVKEIVENGGNIVSGLALGCDSVAHRTCIDNGGKTIAVLPSRLDNVLPKQNNDLANEIVAKRGLLVTEYYNDPVENYELSSRYVERDRLQAYFSNSIILTASYRHAAKEGGAYPQDGIKRDSGSRHAMKIASEIGRKCFVMYNEDTDFDNEMFDLNRDLLEDKKNPAKILTGASIDEMLSGRLPGALPMFEM